MICVLPNMDLCVCDFIFVILNENSLLIMKIEKMAVPGVLFVF